MPGLSKVIVLDPDARACRQVLLGFEREGVPVSVAEIPAGQGRVVLPKEDTGLVVVGGSDGHALDLLRRTRMILDEHQLDAPIVFAGRGVRRTDAEAAGADEVVLLPAYLRDVVTIGRLLRGQPAAQRAHLVGSLAETTGVYTLVRALAALGRSAVLTLIRGLRRGEIRFFHGEVTSAQVGLIHGQAALHQLLLWTEARFDFHHEDVVRRQQIPMSHEELFADAERFLEGVRDSSGKLSPSLVLEQNVTHVQKLGKQIPTEVHGVLRMFDGHRVLADVLEDSPYRVFETLRVAQLAVEVGLLRIVDSQKPRATWRAVLAIEEWLVGADRDTVLARTAADATGPVPKDAGPKPKAGKRKKKKRRGATPVSVPITTAKADIDWGALVPRTVGAELGPLSGVVPASQASGEIDTPSREAPREKLEALMDTGRRERIFPKDIGLEPKVVLDDDGETARVQRERADKARVEAEAAAKAKADAAKAKADADAAKAKADADAAKAKADADAAKAKADADAAKANVKADAPDAKTTVFTKVEADPATDDAPRLARDREDAEARANAEDAKLRAEASEWARTQAKARAKAEDDRATEAAERAQRLAEAKATAAAKPTLAAEGARGDARVEADARATRAVEAAEAKHDAERAATISAMRSVADSVTTDDRATDLVRKLLAEDRESTTAAVTVVETPSATVVVQDTVTVTTTDTTARVTFVPVVTVGEAAPTAAVDDPSDGIVRSIATIDTAPVLRRPPPGEVPPDDRPDDTTGEIASPRPKPPMVEPRSSEPSILVTDLAVVHTAIAAVVTAQATASPSRDAASPSRELAVAEVRKDAASAGTAFSDAEEAFFRAGQEKDKGTKQVPKLDTFDDLDADYQPQGFWDRLRGKRQKHDSTGPVPKKKP